jgi:hypothetical protein
LGRQNVRTRKYSVKYGSPAAELVVKIVPLNVIEEYLDSLREIYTVEVCGQHVAGRERAWTLTDLGLRLIPAQLQQLLQ